MNIQSSQEKLTTRLTQLEVQLNAIRQLEDFAHADILAETGLVLIGEMWASIDEMSRTGAEVST